MTTKPVVVGVDGSAESLRAVEWAALEAKRHSSPLRIVSAPALVPRMHGYNASPAAIANALRGIAARALDAAITRSEEVSPGPVHHDRPAVRTAGARGGGKRRRGVHARGGGARGGRLRGDDARLGQQVRRQPRPVPGRRGPGGEHGRTPRDRGGHPRSAGNRPDAGVRVRGSGAARRGTGRRPHLVLAPVRAAPGPQSCGRPTRTGSRPRPPAAWRPRLGGGATSTQACRSAMTSSAGIPPGCSRATRPAPTSWCSADMVIPPAPAPASALSARGPRPRPRPRGRRPSGD